MADFTIATPAAGVSVAPGAEVFVLSWIVPAGRPTEMFRLKINCRSADAGHVHAVFRIIQADTDGTGTANNALVVPNDPRVTASVPTSRHTYTAGPTGNVRQRWQSVIPPQGAAEYNLAHPQKGIGLGIEPAKVCAVGVTVFGATQIVDVELLGTD